MTTAPIRLLARDEEDLKIVSACLQDAIVPIGDMGYLPDERRFALVVNRFKWETAGKPRPGPSADDDAAAPFERTHCGVRVEEVAAVRFRGIDLKDRGQILELLSVVVVEGGLALHFAGGGCVRLEGTGWLCIVEDLGEPWPTASLPSHTFE